MSNESKTDDEKINEWQALMKEVFEGFKPIFEAIFVKGSANKKMWLQNTQQSNWIH